MASTYIRLYSLFSFIVVTNLISAQKLELSLSPQKMMIGDHAELLLKANQSDKIIFPEINDSSIGKFRVVESFKPDTLFSGQTAMISKRYLITCFEDSAVVFPSLTYYQGLDQSYTTTAIPIQITSPNVDSIQDVKPIKNIILVPLSKSELASYLFMSFILLGLVLLLYLLYIKFIRKEKLFDKEKGQDPPHVVALSALKETENQKLWQSGKSKEYYDRISEVMRTYMEKRFGVKALEQTTTQIIQNMENVGLPDQIIDNLAELLQLADLAKFAKQQPDQESNESILRYAYEIIQYTQINYDANKKANALTVRKFYGQNKYGYKPHGINYDSARIMVFGLIGTLLILSILIALAYFIPIQLLLSYLADDPILFFASIMITGIATSLILMMVWRSRLSNYSLTFDYNCILIRQGNSSRMIPFESILSIDAKSKHHALLTEKDGRKHTISSKLEYYQEIVERISDAMIHSQNSKEE